MRRVKELFVLELPFATKYLRAVYVLLVLIALIIGASAVEDAGGAGG